MTEQHECEWYMCANPAGEIYAMCRDIRCHGKVLKRDEIESRLNEYETLEKKLADKTKQFRAFREARIGHDYITHNEELEKELETLKKVEE